MGQAKRERSQEWKRKQLEDELLEIAKLEIQNYEMIKLLKKIFIFEYTGCWTDRHPQIIEELE